MTFYQNHQAGLKISYAICCFIFVSWCMNAQHPGPSGHSQETLFQIVPEHQLNMQQRNALDQAMERDYALQAWIVKVDHLGNHVEDRTLDLKMPNDVSTTYHLHYLNAYPNVTPQSPEIYSSSSDGIALKYYWSGYGTNGSGFQMYQDREIIRANVFVAASRKAYKIYTYPNSNPETLNNGENIIVCLQYDIEAMREENTCNLHDEEEGEEEEEEEVTFRECDNNRVRVLFLFTAAAAAEGASSTEAEVILNQLNASARAGDLSETEIKFVSAGVQLFSFVANDGDIDETANIDDDLKTIRNSEDYQVIRDTTNADITVVLTASVYSAIFGKADNVGPKEKKAHVIVEMEEATSSFFAAVHEVGHLFGARHQRRSACNSNPDNRTKHHGVKVSFGNIDDPYTVMGACGNLKNVEAFSNVDKDFMGIPIGDEDNDNAKALFKNVAEIACFRNDPSSEEIPVIDIIGSFSICRSTSLLTYSASQTGFGTLINYEWEVSVNGLTGWETVGGNNASLFLPISDLPFSTPVPSFFIRLTVSDGYRTETTIRSVLFMDCLQDEVEGRSNENENHVIPLTFVYNNPVKDVLTIESKHKLGKLSIFSLDGTLLIQQKLEKVNEIPFGHLPKGIYFGKLNQSNIEVSFKIIKI